MCKLELDRVEFLILISAMKRELDDPNCDDGGFHFLVAKILAKALAGAGFEGHNPWNTEDMADIQGE